MAKKKFTTPKGELSWVFIEGEGSFNDLSDKFEYKATITLSAEVAAPLITMCDELWANSAEKKKYDEAFETAKPAMQAKFEMHKGYREELDEDDNPTGNYEFRLKTNTSFETKKGEEKPTVIDVYNAHAKKVSMGDTKIGNGTLGRLSGTALSWYKSNAGGVSLYLTSIQVLKLEEYVENEFEDEGEGYDGSDTEENEFTGVDDVPENSEPEDSEGV